MARRIAHFSCGAASAIATKLSKPNEIWYAETGSEDADNKRFLRDCEGWFAQKVRVLKSDKYKSTWDVWEDRNYLSGINGAPCTSELKIKPQLANQRDDDIHIFGYTCDAGDMRRAKQLRANWPDLEVECPLIERGLTKAACLALLHSAGISPPRVYAMGYPNANCIPCVKATSPAYWALVRKCHPAEFERIKAIEARIGAKLVSIAGERRQLSELPDDIVTTDALAPACDFLCQLAELEFES